MEQVDVVVIGMGPGGEDLAGRLAETHLDVIGIDQRLVGGECPYFGCIPSKMMIRAGNALAEGRRIPGLAGDSRVMADWAPVAARIRNEATDDWNDQVAVDRFEGKGGRFVRGHGRLTGPKTVAVGDREFEARRAIVLNTGTDPVIPPLIDGRPSRIAGPSARRPGRTCSRCSGRCTARFVGRRRPDPALSVAALHRVAGQPDHAFDDIFRTSDDREPVAGGLEDDDVAAVDAVQLVGELVDEHAVVVTPRRAAMQRLLHRPRRDSVGLDDVCAQHERPDHGEQNEDDPLTAPMNLLGRRDALRR